MKIYKGLVTGAIMAGVSMIGTSCTDSWNEHYDAQSGGSADQPSLLANIEADASLSGFLKVVKAIGAADKLNSPQQFTIWAPRNLTDAKVDSIINVYLEDERAGVKYEDNRAVTQFLNNHMAMYSRPISALTNDTVRMLNKKYMTLVGTSPLSGTLDGTPFSDMTLCNNGILYKTDEMQRFFPNIREYLEQYGYKGITGFFKSFDKYELDLQESVEGGVVDGQTVYLDSVTNLTNIVLYDPEDICKNYGLENCYHQGRNYGDISAEDSIYAFLAPTDEVWNKEYEKYSQYFNFPDFVENRDSLQEVTAKQMIIEGRFFNMSKSSKYNQHPEDSLTTTKYSHDQYHNPRTHVYYKPQENILAGLEKVTCSNGEVYVDNKGVVDPRNIFFTRNLSSSYTLPTNAGEPTMTADRLTWATYKIVDVNVDEETGDVSYETKEGKKYSYVAVSAKKNTDRSQITYTIPGVLSNVYYNIYVVTVPGSINREPGNISPDGTSNTLSSWFDAQCFIQTQTSRDHDSNKYGNSADGVTSEKDAYMYNPRSYSEGDDITGYSYFAKESNRTRAFISSPSKVDTILISKAKVFPVSGYYSDMEGTVQIKFTAFGSTSGREELGNADKERGYTRTLRFNQLILVPFETKEEAEAAALDLDAFNDEVLEEKKNMGK